MSTIRRASLADLDQLSNSFDQYRVFYGKQSDRTAAENFLRDRITNGDSVIFVADNNSRLEGFAQLYPLFSSVRMKKLWLLNDLYVNENFRGRGLSVQLINAAKELCKSSGACGMYLETAKANLIGNQLYLKTGFVLNDEHNFYDWSA